MGGDSRCIMVIKTRAIPLSEDHKPQLERLRIESEGGTLEQDWQGTLRVVDADDAYATQLAVSRALGDLSSESASTPGGPHKLKGISAEPETDHGTIPEDIVCFIIACDGLWDVVSNNDCGRLCREKFAKDLNATGVAEALVQRALAEQSTDNVSVVVVKADRA